MFNSFNPLNFVAKREDVSREPDPDNANRDLDSSSANAAADVHKANPDKVSVNDLNDAEPLHNPSEAAYRQTSLESRLEAKLKGAWQRIQQQADQIVAMECETTKQAQISQAKLAYLEKWYSTELTRMEQKLRSYVDTQIVRVHSVYSTPDASAATPLAGQLQATRQTAGQTTYVVPERPNANRASQLNPVSLFLLLLAVGVGLAHLLAAVIVAYTGSSSVLIALSEMTTRQLLPAIAAVIFVSGAIAFTWELRK